MFDRDRDPWWLLDKDAILTTIAERTGLGRPVLVELVDQRQAEAEQEREAKLLEPLVTADGVTLEAGTLYDLQTEGRANRERGMRYVRPKYTSGWGGPIASRIVAVFEQFGGNPDAAHPREVTHEPARITGCMAVEPNAKQAGAMDRYDTWQREREERRAAGAAR